MREQSEQLLAALRRAGVGVDPVELADALWLSRWMLDRIAPTQDVAEDAPVTPTQAPAESTPPAPKPTEPVRDTTPEPSAAPITAKKPPATSAKVSVNLPGVATATGGVGGKPLIAPTARALPDALSLLRALRPLMRRVPARRGWEIDEEETVRRVAEQGLWLPAVRPLRERWLRLTLIVDGSASMGLWQQAIREFTRLVRGSGVFRDVQVWTLHADERDMWVTAGLAGDGPRARRDPREVLDPTGRSAVLLLSDGIGPAWRRGQLTELLSGWCQRLPVALVQLLPEHLWSRTALGGLSGVRLSAKGDLTPSNRLRIEESRDWLELEEATGPLLPILTLEPVAVSAWARLLAGREASLPGVLLAAPTPETGSEEGCDARGLLDRFWRTASATARKLAGLTAAAPVLNLPILRLIRHTQLPEALQVHEAEVMLSGLLRMIESAPSGRAEEVKYDFHDGVRELLLDAVPVARSLAVLEKVSEYVEKHLGMGVGFRALLRDPAAHPGAFIPGEDSFARVAAEVLLRLGGDYARLVQASPPQSGSTRVPSSETPGTSEQTRERVGSPTAWFWVTGLAQTPLPPEVDRISRAVGRILATEGFGLVTGGEQGVDTVVEEALVGTLDEFGAALSRRSHRRYLDVEKQLVYQTVQGVIVIHGRRGTRSAAHTAMTFGKPVIPLAASGGYAQILHAHLLSQWGEYNSPLTRAELEQLREFEESSLQGILRRLAASANQPGVHDPTYWVCVSGTVTQHLDPPLLEVAAQVGRILAEEGYGLQTGGYPGVDFVVAASFAETLSTRSDRSLDRWLRQILVHGQKQEFQGGAVIRVPNEGRQHQTGVREAHVFITMGDVGIGLHFDRWARKMGKPVLPLGSTGGDARTMFEHFLSTWEQFPVPGVSREEFQRLGQPLKGGTVLRQLLRLALSACGGGPPPLPPSAPQAPPGLKWVLVAGQTSAELTKEERDISRTVAHLLAREGYGLMVRGNPGVDLAVATHFAQFLSAHPPQVVRQRLRHCLIRTQDKLHTFGNEVLSDSESEQLYACVEPADVALLIGGGPETRAVGELALALGKPILPVASTGGDAAALHQEMLEQWRPETSPLSLEEFRWLQHNLETGYLLRLLLDKILGPGQPLTESTTLVPEAPIRKWVLVCGDGASQLATPVAAAARQLGRLLAEQSFGLVVGMEPGVDEETTRSFAASLNDRGQSLRGALLQIRSADQFKPALGDFIAVPNEEAQFEEVLRRADVVVLIGGRGMGRRVANRAYRAGRIVLPLSETGGDAHRVYRNMVDTWQPGMMGALTREAFQLLGRPLAQLIPELPSLLRLALRQAQPAGPPQEASSLGFNIARGSVRIPLVIGVLANLSGRANKSRPPLNRRTFRDINERNFDAVLKDLVPPFSQLAPDTPVERLAATWHGLHFLVRQADSVPDVKIRILDVSRTQLFDDLTNAPKRVRGSFFRDLFGGGRTPSAAESVQSSVLYERLIGAPFGERNGEPFGLLVGDFEFSPSEEDCRFLQLLASLCALAQVPWVAAPASESLGLHRRHSPDSTAWDRSEPWQQFRLDRAARYAALALPRVLARPADDEENRTPVDALFHNPGSPSRTHLWMSGAWAYAAQVVKAFGAQGWCLGAVGALPELPLRSFGDDGNLQGAPEVVVVPQEALWVASKGLLAICWDPAHPSGLIPTPASCFGRDRVRSQNTMSNLNYLLTASQIVRALMIQTQSQLHAGTNIATTEQLLRSWLLSYIGALESTPAQERLLHPLTRGKVDLNAVGTPPRYELSISLELFAPQDSEPLTFTTVVTLPPLR